MTKTRKQNDAATFCKETRKHIMQLMFVLVALTQDKVYETHMQLTHSHDINARHNIYKTHKKSTHDRSQDTDAIQSI